MNNCFTYFQTFFLKQTMRKLSFLCFHITIIISIKLKSNFTKERRMYEYVWTHFIYNYIYLCRIIHISTYSCMKNFLMRIDKNDI